MKTPYERYRKWEKQNPEKRKAHTLVMRALRRGDIKREPCYCGAPAQAHHEDYKKPEEIVWLCKSHHMEADKNLRKGIKLPANIQRVLIPKVVHSNTLHTVQAESMIDPMKATVEALRRNRVYTLKEITHIVPWAKNWRTARNILEADMDGPNLLQCEITGTGSRRRYLVQGRHLISYLKTYGPALMATVRKPKQKYGKKRNNKSAGSGDQGRKTR